MKDSHIIQYDACLFSANSYTKEQWSPVGMPLLTKQKYVTSNVVCVYGFISVEHGGVYFHVCEQQSFTKWDLIRCIGIIKNMFKDDYLVFFGNNSRVHTNQDVETAVSDLGANMMFNVAYRPDLMGVEKTWARCKKLYKDEVARLHISQKVINNFDVVKKVIKQISNEDIKYDAAYGWRKFLNAEPIDYEQAISSSSSDVGDIADDGKSSSSESEFEDV